MSKQADYGGIDRETFEVDESAASNDTYAFTASRVELLTEFFATLVLVYIIEASSASDYAVFAVSTTLAVRFMF